MKLEYDKFQSIIQTASVDISKQWDDIVIEGLKRKGFEFNTREELESFIKDRCHCEDRDYIKELTYFVDKEPFLLRVYGLEIDQDYDIDNPKFVVSGGKYKFL